jgi:DNA sulfur modification protein DndC
LIDELWQYLLQAPPPWGGTHRELITLYRNASGGDCPLIIDKTTPSCGQSRFGCWVCTVVNKDKSMDFLIDNGDDWMEPLQDIRNFLIESRDKPETFREKRRRNGQINERYWGPYKFETRVKILKMLLKAQKQIQETENIELITHQEMVLIQYHWFRDSFFKTKVSDIYKQVYKTQLTMSKNEEKHKEEFDLLKKSCANETGDLELIQNLLALQKTKTLMVRKRGLRDEIETAIEQHIKNLNSSENN